MAFLSSTTALVAVYSLVALATGAAAQDWFDGRATFYGTDAWKLDIGSCGYGYLSKDVGTGWDVAALPDTDPLYSGSHTGAQCGKCREVKCRNGWLTDGYGESFDRSSVCFDSDASVVVQIVDTCDCNYAPNAYSNRRWCCGDMRHMDLSYWAYTKLADPKWGVIPTSMRDVPCSYMPRKKAVAPSWIDPKAYINARPSGWTNYADKRIAMTKAAIRSPKCKSGFKCKN